MAQTVAILLLMALSGPAGTARGVTHCDGRYCLELYIWRLVAVKQGRQAEALGSEELGASKSATERVNQEL
jgi:hypothetical protein